MKRSEIELSFFDTYYFANVIWNVLSDRFNYLRELEAFYAEGSQVRFATPFPKNSAVHQFISFMVDSVIADEVDEVKLDIRQDMEVNYASIPQALESDPACFSVNEALTHHGIEHTSFREWLKENRSKTFQDARDDDVFDYYSDLRLEQGYENLLDQMANEVFFVIFQNRRLLLLFNDMIADQMESLADEDIGVEYKDFFRKPGVLKRTSIPEWAKRSVFYRDRGLCTLCRTDLSGTLSISNQENYDHIVPLAQGGLNDVSNLQLVCATCNCKKGGRNASTSDLYEHWYSP